MHINSRTNCHSIVICERNLDTVLAVYLIETFSVFPNFIESFVFGADVSYTLETIALTASLTAVLSADLCCEQPFNRFSPLDTLTTQLSLTLPSSQFNNQTSFVD